MEIIGIIGVLIALFLLAFIVFKGWNVMYAALAATIVVIVTSGLDFTTGIVTNFFPGVAGFFSSYLGKVLFSAIFAQIYSRTGAATSIAQGLVKLLFRENSSQNTKQMVIIFIVFMSSLLLTYGGLGAVLCLFIVWPILLPLYEQVNIPRKFAVANMMFGSITLANCGPGAPVVPNVVAIKELGTTAMAAAVPGFICMIVEIVLMMILFNRMINKSKAKGESFTLPSSVPDVPEGRKPNAVYSLVPMIVTLALFAGLDWAIEIAILVGIVVGLGMFWPWLPKEPSRYESIKSIFHVGFSQSLPTTAAMAGIQGFSAVFSATTTYGIMINGITSINMSPVLLVIIMVGALSCILAANATALVVALPILRPVVEPLGMSMSALHRIACFTGSVLDTVPWSGTINLAAAMTETTVKDDYPSIFVTTVVVPAVGVALMAVMYLIAPGMF